MTEALISAYVRPEGAYITASDRTTAGVWTESGDWEFVPMDEPGHIGEAILRRLAVVPRVVPHPRRDEFSTIHARTIGPLLTLAGVKTWKAFTASVTLVHIQRHDATTVTPMRRDGRGFSPVPEGRERIVELVPEAVGLAVLKAAVRGGP